MADEDDLDLWKQSRDGDLSAFEKLIRRYEGRLFNPVFRLLGNKEDAQDVVQETFIKGYLSLHTFRRDSQFFTWLYRIAYNLAVDHRRKKGGGPKDMERIKKALDQLSPEHKMVLVLKELEGRKLEEIAEVLGLPIGTVRSRLHEARLELRNVLEEEPADPDKEGDTPIIVESGKRTDSQLIADAQHGSRQAFQQLLSRYEAQLASIVRELVADPAVRASIREQVVAAIFTELATIPRDRPFVSWLFQLAKRTTGK